jgi:hypothetical protein
MHSASLLSHLILHRSVEIHMSTIDVFSSPRIVQVGQC